MKKIILGAAILFIATPAVFAQQAMPQNNAMTAVHPPAPTPEQHAQAMTERMDKVLTLSAEQKKSMYDVNLKAVQQMDKIRQENMQNHTNDKSGMMALMQTREAEIQKILTPEQYEKYKNTMGQRPVRSPQMSAPAQAPGAPAIAH
ncbi:MAG TPA: hypothetical protein VN721_00380 [Flavipsychrobacter sp.]|nr:hypothetical protein [Flavipsychrobacter sp.]